MLFLATLSYKSTSPAIPPTIFPFVCLLQFLFPSLLTCVFLTLTAINQQRYHMLLSFDQVVVGVGLFSSISELSRTGCGWQFMASSHTGNPAAPTANPYQLCLIHVRKTFSTLKPLPKFLKISKVFYMETTFPRKLAFRTVQCK